MRKFFLALVISLFLGATYTYAPAEAQVVSSGGSRRTINVNDTGTSVVSVDDAGYLSVQNSLPFKIKKEILPNGLTRYSAVTLDGGQEKIIAFADY